MPRPLAGARGGSDDEVACGGAAQELGGPMAGCSEEGARDGFEEDGVDEAVVGAVSSAAVLFAVPGAEGEGGVGVLSSAAAGASEEASSGGEGDGLSISELGYVRSTAERFASIDTIGLICLYADAKIVCASCHLHPKCAIKVSILKEGIEHDRLASWLALGEPCKGQSKEERMRLGAAHRKRWRRHGPLG